MKWAACQIPAESLFSFAGAVACASAKLAAIINAITTANRPVPNRRSSFMNKFPLGCGLLGTLRVPKSRSYHAGRPNQAVGIRTGNGSGACK